MEIGFGKGEKEKEEERIIKKKVGREKKEKNGNTPTPSKNSFALVYDSVKRSREIMEYILKLNILWIDPNIGYPLETVHFPTVGKYKQGTFLLQMLGLGGSNLAAGEIFGRV